MAQLHKRNAVETKIRLLEAAQAAFAAKGYSGVGIRDIAASAGVNSALLARYFGSKAALFEAALVQSIDFEALASGPRAQFGQRLANRLIAHGSGPQKLPFSVPTTDAQGADILARVTEEHAVRPLALWLGEPDGRSRALKIVMLASALCLYQRHSRFSDDETGEPGSMGSWFARVVQEIVDGR